MDYYMDDHKSKRKSSLSRSISQKTPSSQKHGSSGLSRSSSQKIPSTKSGNSSSQRYSEFTRMAKEQKSKFYIVKRCITMLVSWKKHDDC
ncbi:protein TPRXL [Dorcoceras hygrometricum]|uniref:Protein TPRXL n=1 Tax=Dorcoceras hygrometricum TaxID=472368 RepID=A0A2Z7D052_9LAMI|nr:protein TPRXL [Dorcoceras hygrometricum]